MRQLEDYLFEYPAVAAMTVVAFDLSGLMKWSTSTDPLQEAVIWTAIVFFLPGLYAFILHTFDFTNDSDTTGENHG